MVTLSLREREEKSRNRYAQVARSLATKRRWSPANRSHGKVAEK
jgi:hypothetical protein